MSRIVIAVLAAFVLLAGPVAAQDPPGPNGSLVEPSQELPINGLGDDADSRDNETSPGNETEGSDQQQFYLVYQSSQAACRTATVDPQSGRPVTADPDWCLYAMM